MSDYERKIKLAAGETWVPGKDAFDKVVAQIANDAYRGGDTPGNLTNLKTEQPGGALKYDNEKPDLSLIPTVFEVECAKAFMYGANKYGRYNYRKGMEWHRLIAAAKRHLAAFQDGEELDPESGVSHLGHAAACIAMLTVYQSEGLGSDTRLKK